MIHARVGRHKVVVVVVNNLVEEFLDLGVWSLPWKAEKRDRNRAAVHWMGSRHLGLSLEERRPVLNACRRNTARYSM